MRDMFVKLGLSGAFNALATEPWRQVATRAASEQWARQAAESVQRRAEQEWQEAVHSETGTSGRGGNKLRLYKLIKTRWGAETYLRAVRHFAARRLLTRLRGGVLRLRVEEGRFEAQRAERRGRDLTDEQREAMRHCPFCLGRVEDEVHFVLACATYQQLRTHMMQAAATHMGEAWAAVEAACGRSLGW